MTRALAAVKVADLLGEFGRAPAWAGLAEGLRALVVEGRVPAGTRLPSERDLSVALGLSRTTVTRAYAALRDHGYLVSRTGSGSVAALPGGDGRGGDHLLPPGDAAEGVLDLTVAAHRPGPGLLAAYQRATEALPEHLAGTGYYPSGLGRLREVVAAAYDARGLPTDPRQVLVVPGALAGLAIAARALLGAGDRAVLESPTYPSAIVALRRAGARLVGSDLPPDSAERGYDTDGLVATLRQVAPRMTYLVPDFHNPTGALMTAEDRERVAGILARTGTTAVVDETMVALALDGQDVPPPFAAFAPTAISVGSLSKAYWGGVRIGWLRVPAPMVDTVFSARLSQDLGAALLEQLVAVELLTRGGELLAHRREQLRASRDATVAALAEHLPSWTLSTPGGGLALWCHLPAALSSALVPHAAHHDVLLAPGPAFAPEGGLDGFCRIPFTSPPAVMTDAVARIGQAWEQTLAEPGPFTRRGPTMVA